MCAELTTAAYEALVASALKAGLIELLGTNLSLCLTPQSALGALKASYIACNLAADSEVAAEELMRLTPILIAHVGLSYGSALCTQCAWTLSNLATISTVAACTLVAQGAIPTLLEVLEDAGRTPEEPSRAYAGATCAWALSNIVRSTGDSKAANTLLSVTEPPVDTLFSRVLTHGFVDADLCAESAWLLVHTLENVATSATALACRGGIVQALCWCLEAAVADSGEDAQAQLSTMRERWLREGEHAWEQCVGKGGHASAHAQNASNQDQAMREPVPGAGMHDSDDDSDMEASNPEPSRSSGRQIIDTSRLWLPGQSSQQHPVHGEAACMSAQDTEMSASEPVQGVSQGGLPAVDRAGGKGGVTEAAVPAGGQGGLQLQAGEPKWGMELDTSRTSTSDILEHSLLATSQFSARTVATSEGRGVECGRDAAGAGVLGGSRDGKGGLDAAGRNVAEGESMASEGGEEAEEQAPVNSLVWPLFETLTEQLKVRACGYIPFIFAAMNTRHHGRCDCCCSIVEI